MTTDALLNHSDCLVATSAFGTKLTFMIRHPDTAFCLQALKQAARKVISFLSKLRSENRQSRIRIFRPEVSSLTVQLFCLTEFYREAVDSVSEPSQMAFRDKIDVASRP